MAEQLLNPKTGQGTAGAVEAVLDADYSIFGFVRISILSTEANGIEVLSDSDTDGDLLEPGNSRTYFAPNLNKIKVRRNGGSDVNFTFYAF